MSLGPIIGYQIYEVEIIEQLATAVYSVKRSFIEIFLVNKVSLYTFELSFVNSSSHFMQFLSLNR
jgi:hypothetical protein